MILPYRPDLVFDFPESYLARSPGLKRKFEHFTQCKLIGYWRALEHEQSYFPTWIDLPDPRNFIDDSWARVERMQIAKYLDSAKIIAKWLGHSICRICDQLNGSLDMSDDVYIWPAGFSHYIVDHGVKPPKEFLDHCYRCIGTVLVNNKGK